jgi:hypothetical protein
MLELMVLLLLGVEGGRMTAAAVGVRQWSGWK